VLLRVGESNGELPTGSRESANGISDVGVSCTLSGRLRRGGGVGGLGWCIDLERDIRAEDCIAAGSGVAESERGCSCSKYTKSKESVELECAVKFFLSGCVGGGWMAAWE
jgi:hypothetical protein